MENEKPLSLQVAEFDKKQRELEKAIQGIEEQKNDLLVSKGLGFRCITCDAFVNTSFETADVKKEHNSSCWNCYKKILIERERNKFLAKFHTLRITGVKMDTTMDSFEALFFEIDSDKKHTYGMRINDGTGYIEIEQFEKKEI